MFEANRLHLIVEGEDGLEGRGLLVMSALTLFAEPLTHVPITVLTTDNPAVDAAARVLRHDCALDIRTHHGPDGLDQLLRTASLYVSVVAYEGHMSAGLLAAQRAGTPILTPVQFPSDRAAVEQLALVRAAHDPRVLGETIMDRIGLAS